MGLERLHLLYIREHTEQEIHSAFHNYLDSFMHRLNSQQQHIQKQQSMYDLFTAEIYTYNMQMILSHLITERSVAPGESFTTHLSLHGL